MNLNTQAAVLKVLLDTVKAAYEGVRGPADDRLRDLYEQDGVLSVEVRITGYPTSVAKVTLSPGEAAVAVDQAARLAWCKLRYPEEVETETITTERVRPAFVKVLDSRLKVDDDGVVLDPETGEMIEWARRVPAGPPKSTMTFAPGGRDAIAEAYRRGVLSLPELLASAPRALEGSDG